MFQPAPDTDGAAAAAGTLAAVRLRLAALRSSLRRAPVHSAAAAALAPQAGHARSAPAAKKRAPQRPAHAAAAAPAAPAAAAAAAAAAGGGDSTDDSGAENGGLIARRTRGALQLKGRGAPPPGCWALPPCLRQ